MVLLGKAQIGRDLWPCPSITGEGCSSRKTQRGAGLARPLVSRSAIPSHGL